jgi:predicted CXXCH cytochrome family protein
MQDVLKKKDVHPALVSGCTSCHNPHGGKFVRMLDQQLPQLCFGCHTDIDDMIKESAVSHPALDTDASCAACHSPHSSDNDKLLIKPQKETCLECHDDVIPKNAKYQHGPNNDGLCARCHSPHGSKYEKLLIGTFPEDAYVPYTSKAYGLCFSCHKRDLLEYPETSFATGFRNGNKNLHYVHVNDDKKGRSCRLCHSWHGSNNPKLIADTVIFGKWNLPLRFVKTETGGGCSPGCHNPRYYDREQPGRKPPPVKPATPGTPGAPAP